MHEVSFHRVAHYYDRLAKLVFGKSIQQAQYTYLHKIPEDSHVLLIGGGSGWILEKLILDGRCSRITFLETAPAMISRAKRVCHRLTGMTDVKIDFVLGSVSALSPDVTFDVVLTFFLLDLYPTREAGRLVNTLNFRLKSNGTWLFADFDPMPQKHIPLWQSGLLWLMYRFFRLTTNLKNYALPDYNFIFFSAGLHLKESKYFFGSFIRSAVYQKS